MVNYKIRELKRKLKASIKGPPNILQVYRSMDVYTYNRRREKPPQISLGNWIGIEIECKVPYASNGVPCGDCEGCYEGDGCNNLQFDSPDEDFYDNLHNERPLKNIQVTEDGSVHSDEDYAGVEIILLTHRNTLYKDLKTTLSWLKNMGAIVDHQCGLHIHFDCRHLNLNQVSQRMINLIYSYPFLTSLVPKSRLNNQYCQPGSGVLGGGRYYAFNPSSLDKYGTIEIRLHSGTLDYNKIVNWIELIGLIMNSNLTRFVYDIKDLNKFINIPISVENYLKERIKKFKRKTKSISIHDLLLQINYWNDIINTYTFKRGA